LRKIYIVLSRYVATLFKAFDLLLVWIFLYFVSPLIIALRQFGRKATIKEMLIMNVRESNLAYLDKVHEECSLCKTGDVPTAIKLRELQIKALVWQRRTRAKSYRLPNCHDNRI